LVAPASRSCYNPKRMPDETTQARKPDVLALVIADQVLRDVASNKFYIQGTYSVITAPEFPWHHPVPIVVYAAITNGQGKMPIGLRLVDVDDEHEVFTVSGEMDFPDPLVVVELVLANVGALFPAPGEYRLELQCRGEVVKVRQLRVIPAGPPSE
jgi:hypothetical protein